MQWDVINEVINIKKYSVYSDKFIINDKRVLDRLIIANPFNDLYVNLGPNLSEGFLELTQIQPNLLHMRFHNLYFVLQVSEMNY